MSTIEQTRPDTSSALRFAWRVLVWSVLLFFAAVVVLAVLLPRAVGATPYTVLTGSMQPDYPPGTLVVIKPVELDEIAVGDVITYQLRSGEPDVVTHRVVAVGSSLDGSAERTLRTQGDANDVPDQQAVSEVQIKGRLWYAVPHLGRAGTWIDTSQRQAATLVVAGGLAVYALWMVGSATADRRNNRNRKGGGQVT